MHNYVCHKRVKATQLIEKLPNEWRANNGQFYSDAEVKTYHRGEYSPLIGDYLVEYGDGYHSISPQRAFEEGYVRTDGEEQPDEAGALTLSETDDGEKVALDSYTGGGSKEGLWGRLTLRFTNQAGEDYTQDYIMVKDNVDELLEPEEDSGEEA